VIMLEILNILLQAGCPTPIRPEAMRAAIDNAFPGLRDKIDALWADCPPSCQDLLRRVVEEGALPYTTPNADADALIERGFLHHAANKLQRPSRLLAKYLQEQPNEGNALARLFGRNSDYQQQFKGVLERRIAHISGLDPALKRYLQRGVEDLPDHPSVFLGNAHGILEQSLTLIWKAECWHAEANKPHIPSGWISIWRRNGEKYPDEYLTRFPEGGQRLRLLDLMTGTQKTDRVARFITKNTYVLANAVQGFRDFGVHPKGAEIDLGTAYAALHVCIELAAAITSELAMASR
jgi:hypothetical protein